MGGAWVPMGKFGRSSLDDHMETLATTAHNLLENGFFSSELEGGPGWSRPVIKTKYGSNDSNW